MGEKCSLVSLKLVIFLRCQLHEAKFFLCKDEDNPHSAIDELKITYWARILEQKPKEHFFESFRVANLHMTRVIAYKSVAVVHFGNADNRD